MGMVIEPDSRFFGLSAKQARDLMHEIHIIASENMSFSFTLRAVNHAVRKVVFVEYKHIENYQTRAILNKKSEETALSLINNMLLDNWIISVGADEFKLTDKAMSLSRHKFIKRITRENALQKLTEFLHRVIDWNNTNPYVMVMNVWLYGSMLTDSPDVGDIDLVCQYLDNKSSPTYPTESEIMSLIMSNKDFLYEVKTHIKNRSPYISIDGFNPGDLGIINNGSLKLINNGVLTHDARKIIVNKKEERKQKKAPIRKWFYLGVMKEQDDMQFGIAILDAKFIFSEIFGYSLYRCGLMVSKEDIGYAIENYVFKKNKTLGRRYWTEESELESNELKLTLTDKMISEGFIAQYEEPHLPKNKYFKATEKGIEFNLLKSSELITRLQANKIINTFLERVLEWNSEKHYMQIINAWVYGAIATNSAEIGDIELIWETKDNRYSPDYYIDGIHYYTFNHRKHLEEKALKFFTMRLPRLSIQNHDPEFMKFIENEGHCIQIVQDHKVIYSVPT